MRQVIVPSVKYTISSCRYSVQRVVGIFFSPVRYAVLLIERKIRLSKIYSILGAETLTVDVWASTRHLFGLVTLVRLANLASFTRAFRNNTQEYTKVLQNKLYETCRVSLYEISNIARDRSLISCARAYEKVV
jgi:hypothetical protein